MQITLSGGSQGGQVVTWTDGQTAMTFDGLIYTLIPGTTQAVYTGPAD